MRQVLFRILEQTEIIEDAQSGILRRPYLSEKVEQTIVKDDAKWLAIFLYSNNEISNLHELYG
jgi:predicted transcriptional regulator